MREISFDQIVEAVKKLCIDACTYLPHDLRQALERSVETESSPVGKGILGDIIDNYRMAAERGLPICQDTGMALIFAEVGQEVHITGGSFEQAIDQGVAMGYVEGRLRCSTVSDPLRRVNAGDNTPAIVHLRLVPGDHIKLTVAPKGFGSENMTVLKMFKPSATAQDVVDLIVQTVDTAGSNPCPPVVVGVGLGGDAEKAAQLAKQALLLPADAANPDPLYARLEKEALERINALGIGPQGLGGSTTALCVHILPFPTHIAGLPCAVSLGCHATRHAQALL